MMLGLTKLHPALAGWVMVLSGPAATSAGASLLLGWRVDLVKDPAVPEMFRLHRGPAPEFGVINTDPIEFGEAVQQGLILDGLWLAGSLVVPCLVSLRLGRIEVLEIHHGQLRRSVC